MKNNNQNQWKHKDSRKNTAAGFIRKQLLKVCLLFCWVAALLISGRYVLFGNRSAVAPETVEQTLIAQTPEELELSEQEGSRSESIDNDVIYTKFFGLDMYLAESGSIQLKVTDAENEAITGAEFALYRDAEPNGEVSAANLINRYNSNKSGIITVGLPEAAQGDRYFFIQENAPAGYEYNAGTKYYFEVLEDGSFQPQSLTVTNTRKTGSVRLRVISDEDIPVPLPGAKFKLYSEDGTGLDITGGYSGGRETFSTNEDGYIIIQDLPFGNYYLIETEPPAGYELTYNTRTNLTISEAGYNEETGSITVFETITNSRILGYVRLQSGFVDGSPSDLSGIVYELFDDATNVILGEYYSNEYGVVSDQDGDPVVGPLPFGTYYFKEKSLPEHLLREGYVINTEILRFEITESLSVENAILLESLHTVITGGIEVRVVDETSNSPLRGIRFGVYREESDNSSVRIATVVSDVNGNVRAANLPIGGYYLIEDGESVEQLGYLALETKYYFTISPDDAGKSVSLHEGSVDGEEIVIISLSPRKGTVSLQLRDEYNDVLTAEGAAFLLYYGEEHRLWLEEKLIPGNNYICNEVNGIVDFTIEEGQPGAIVVSGLPWETYYFEEIKAPVGYSLTEPVSFQLTADGDKMLVLSSKRLGIGLAAKDALSGEYLSGVSLSVLDGSGNVIDSWTSGSDPHIVSAMLEVGKTYSLHQTKTPEGYKSVPDVQFTMENNDIISKMREIVLEYVPTGTVSITVNLEWVLPRDGNGVAQMDYPTVTLDLYGISEKYPEGKLFASGEVRGDMSSYTFTDLPEYDEYGERYTFKVREKATEEVADFDIVYGPEGSFTIRHIVKQERIDIRVALNWMIPEESGVSPVDVTIHLLRDGMDTGVSQITYSDCVFTNLDKYDLSTGYEYEYTLSVEEVTAFKTEITKESGYVIRLTPIQKPFAIRGSVSWSGDENASRPSVTALLYRDGSLYKEDTVDVSGSFGFTDLYVYAQGEDGDVADGHTYNYEVKQRGAERYSRTITYGESRSARYDSTDIVRSGSELYLPVTVQNTFRTSRISISAENGMGGPLAGARLEILDNSGQSVESWTSTGTPYVADGLMDGVYRIVSLSEPTGYNRPSEYIFSVSEASWEYTITMRYTAKTGGVRLTVKDDSGAVIPGVTYELYSNTPHSSSQSTATSLYGDAAYLYKTCVSDENGEIIVNGLPWDDYFFVQTEVPEGYMVTVSGGGDPIVNRFEISAVTADFVQPLESRVTANVPTPTPEPAPTPTLEPIPSPTPSLTPDLSGSVTLYVRRTSGGTGLSGADLKLYRVDNDILETLTRIGTYTSGVNGRVDVQNLSLGKYYFVQTKAPSGYRADNRAVSFELTYSKVEAVVEFSEK